MKYLTITACLLISFSASNAWAGEAENVHLEALAAETAAKLLKMDLSKFIDNPYPYSIIHYYEPEIKVERFCYELRKALEKFMLRPHGRF